MTRAIALLVAASAVAQAPQIGEINFYGLHKVTPAQILSTLHLRAGGPLPPSKGELEDLLEKIPGVVLARVEAVCCEGPEAALFIGIEERGAPHPAFRSQPESSATLPDPLLETYQRFLEAVERAALKGNAGEDLTAGHSQMADREARACQEQFAAFATEHVDELRDVLRNSSEPAHRAAAAVVIGYGPKKREIVNDLQYALQDPEPAVRASAARSLAAVAVLAGRQPELEIHIEPTWFLEMLNSIVLSDRMESAKALLILTDGSNQAALARIRESGLGPLAEMARWKTPRYALPPFLLLGRAGGMSDAQIHELWQKGDREAVIRQAMGGGKKR